MKILCFKEWMSEYGTIIENVIQKDADGRPVQLDLHFPNGELQPPVCRATGIVFTGKGLIAFDFDQTLTTAWFGHPRNPKDQGSHSTADPNPIMLQKMNAHKQAGNKVIIVTARGEKEGQLRGDASHFKGLQPIVTADKTIGYSGLDAHAPNTARDWNTAIKKNPAWKAIPQAVESPSLAFHLGAVSLGTKGESKGPFIAAKMAYFNMTSKHSNENPHPETGQAQGNYMWGILYDDGNSNVVSANAQQKKGVALAGIPVAQQYEKGGEKPDGVVATRSASGI